ncbi:MAG: hypothetical protein ACRC0Y_08935 [Fusobacteriaceae bacterium]
MKNLERLIESIADFHELKTNFQYEIIYKHDKILFIDIQLEILEKFSYIEFANHLLYEFFNREALKNLIELRYDESDNDYLAFTVEEFFNYKNELEKAINKK